MKIISSLLFQTFKTLVKQSLYMMNRFNLGFYLHLNNDWHTYKPLNQEAMACSSMWRKHNASEGFSIVS